MWLVTSLVRVNLRTFNTWMAWSGTWRRIFSTGQNGRVPSIVMNSDHLFLLKSCISGYPNIWHTVFWSPKEGFYVLSATPKVDLFSVMEGQFRISPASLHPTKEKTNKRYTVHNTWWQVETAKQSQEVTLGGFQCLEMMALHLHLESELRVHI